MSMNITLKNVVQKYGDKLVLDNISLNLNGPSMTMLLGPSGCGKSTLMHMMGGVRPLNVKTPTSGEIHVLGAPCDDVHPDVSMVFQSYANRPDLTVWENVFFPFRLKLFSGVPKGTAETRCREMLKAVGLDDKLKHRPSQLSGGQNQRLALARSLVMQPKVLLMDEPFGALDPKTRSEMQELLIKLYEEFPCLIVFVTHDVTEAIRLGDRVLVMSPAPAKIADDFQIATPKNARKGWLDGSEARALEQRILGLLHTVDGSGQVRVTV